MIEVFLSNLPQELSQMTTYGIHYVFNCPMMNLAWDNEEIRTLVQL